MRSSIVSALVILFLLQFIGPKARAMTCASVVGKRVLTLNVISKRLKHGVHEASGSLQTLEVEGALEGYYSAVAVGVSPSRAKASILEGLKVRLHSFGVKEASQAYFTAVGVGLSPIDVSNKIQAAKIHQPRFNGKHGLIEGFYLAVVFGVDPAEASKSVHYGGIHRFPNIKNFKNLLTSFYAGLAFGIPAGEAGININQAYQVESMVAGQMRKGVLSGFYFGAAIRNDLFE